MIPKKLTTITCGVLVLFFSLGYTVQAQSSAPISSLLNRDTGTNALIATIGVVAGAVLTSLAAAYSARQKVREIELTYRQKLRENYLANARLYTNNIYVPISIAFRKLGDGHQRFRSRKDTEDDFRYICSEYEKTISNLFERGADAFLTTELEERLRSFNNFLVASLETKEVVAKAVIKFRLLNTLITTPMRVSSKASSGLRGLRETIMSSVKFENISVGGFGLGFTYNVEEILAAPITSKEFERRISGDIPALKFLIKEVTLGAHSGTT